MADDRELPKVKITYREGRDFRVLPVTGARGGLTAQGLVYASLFHERMTGPHEVTLDQAAGKEAPVSSELVLVERTEEVGLLMTPEVARSISEWLQRHLQRLEEAASPPGADARDTEDGQDGE